MVINYDIFEAPRLIHISVADPGISGGGDINPAGGLGGAVSPQWGPGAKPLATQLTAISCVFYSILTD